MTRSYEKSSVSVAVAFALTLLTAFGATSHSARTAYADIPPPDVCAQAGQSCNKAGDHFDQPGTCTASTCSHTLPSGDGKLTTTTFACNKCVATTTAIAAPASPDASVPAVPPIQPSEKKGGCDVGGASSSAPGEWLLGVGIALAILPRKKRTSFIVEG